MCFGSEKCSKTQAQTIDHTLQSDSETLTFRFTAKAPKHCFAEMSKSDEISEGEIK